MTFNDQQNDALILGNNFTSIFGGAEITSGPASSLFSASLTDTRSVTEVVAGATACTLSDVYNMLSSLSNDSLFVVDDTAGNPQIVFVYTDELGQHVVSPMSTQVPVWYAGTTLYSTSNITNI